MTKLRAIIAEMRKIISKGPLAWSDRPLPGTIPEFDMVDDPVNPPKTAKRRPLRRKRDNDV